MTSIWEKYDNKVDLDGFKEDVKEASEGSGEFEDLPTGKYEVALESIELKETKESKKPMITSIFKVVAGNYENRLIWSNQVVEKPAGMAMGLRLINAMEPEQTIEFDSYSQLASDLENAAKHIKNNFEFVLDISENKGFTNYKIKEVFDLE